MLDLAYDILSSDGFGAILDRHAKAIGFRSEMLRWGFDTMAARWTSDAFVDLVHREAPVLLGDEAVFRTRIESVDGLEAIASAAQGQSYASLFLVSASTVPSAAFQDAMIPLLLPLRVTLKPARRLSPLFEDILCYLHERFPVLAKRIRLFSAERDEEALLKALASHDVVNISGSDASIASFEALITSLPKTLRPKMIAHGHRLSAMIVREDELEHLNEAEIAKMAVDLSVWDQEGCLSPKCLFVEASASRGIALAQKLVSALDHLALSLPELSPPMEILAAKNSAIRFSQIDGAVVIRATKNHDVIVVHPEGAAFEPLLLPRCLNIYPCQDALLALAQLSPRGQAVGSLTPIADEASLSAYGYNYFAPFGEMQDPPLDWCHDGIGTLKPLLREG